MDSVTSIEVIEHGMVRITRPAGSEVVFGATYIGFPLEEEQAPEKKKPGRKPKTEEFPGESNLLEEAQ